MVRELSKKVNKFREAEKFVFISEQSVQFSSYKAELPKEGILFHTQFPSLGIFINKKVGFRKN